MPDQRQSSMTLKGLNAWYGESHVLHGIDIDLNEGEVVSLLGRNGAGKTTTLRSIMGMVDKRQGSIAIHGRETIGLPSRQIARMGVGYVPEERGIYASLSVRENLALPPRVSHAGYADEELFELFPNLRERLSSAGNRLSGGEQQMLALARVLRTGSKLLLLDELTEGLAPVIVQQIAATVRKLRDRRYTALLVESNFRFARSVADRHLIVEQGRIVDVFTNEQLDRNLEKLNNYLGV
ncbi:ABC transporter ATP-binding protein [Agrobacterium tumefaciens]|uniref:ABC transporter ATP-binding protein n=1 Tax=Agrobacterium tumefaciens TaxID=358 RepID=UPI00157180C0|nr:ABC transporter ATP-binding protein [Agrobacterium tumefaciens]NTB94895.1 ABC transporter ATP-binding protein [Agrobacterium tumefaciens]NTC44016.1 ABC transporter ATP-binding protein [Agrobacterium tumefaciens]